MDIFTFKQKPNDIFFEIIHLIGKPLVIGDNININDSTNDNNWFLYDGIKFQSSYDHEVEIVKHKGGTHWLYKKISLRLLLQYNL
jgi:hypothetical protein